MHKILRMKATGDDSPRDEQGCNGDYYLQVRGTEGPCQLFGPKQNGTWVGASAIPLRGPGERPWWRRWLLWLESRLTKSRLAQRRRTSDWLR